MSNHDWYDVTEGDSLLQGDILRDCPVFAVSGSLSWPLETAADIEIVAKVFDLVVMTQSCDLENDKVEDILLAQLVAWSDAVRAEVERGNDTVRSRKFRRLLIDGNVPGLSLLHRRDGSPALPWSVVDFHRLFTLPKAFVAGFAMQSGSRLRLRSPYREHLAQGLARYFMRVGLPHDAKAFELEGAVP